MRFFITFTCYGARLHGQELGSVDRRRNLFGSRLVEPDPQRALAERGWMLQSTHVHLIIEAEIRPEKIRNELKAYASRELNRLGRMCPIENAGPGMKARDGFLKDHDVRDALRYVIEEQGDPMALFISEEL